MSWFNNPEHKLLPDLLSAEEIGQMGGSLSRFYNSARYTRRNYFRRMQLSCNWDVLQMSRKKYVLEIEIKEENLL